MKVTVFGKRVRDYRMQLDILLKDMAKGLGFTSAYISGMETGKKDLTDKYIDSVVEFFRGRGIDASDLYELADQSREEVRIRTDHMDKDSKVLVAAFARRFNHMSDRKKRELEALLEL